MSSPPLNPTSFRYPFQLSDESTLQEVIAAVRYHSSGIVDLNQAIAALKPQVDTAQSTAEAAASATPTSSGVKSFNTLVGNVTYFPQLGMVNDQRGNLTYLTEQTDNGAKIIVADSSPIVITLNAAVAAPWFTFIDNDSSATATLSPSSGSLFGEQSIPGNGFGIVFFDGTNFFCGAAQAPGAGSGITQLTGPVTAGPGSGSQATAITAGAIGTTQLANSAVTLAKIANAAANSVLVGSGASGSGSPYVEVALGTNLSMSGTTLNAVAAGMVNITGLLTPTGATISGGVATATSVASFTLASIPSTFTHLKIILIGQVTSAADVSMQFNADTAAHYDWGFSVLGGSSGSTSNDTSGHTAGLPTSGGTVYPGQVEIIIPFYKTTTFRKSYQGWNTKPNAGQIFLNGGWQNTAAITGITFLSVGTTFTTALATVYGLL